MKTLFSILDKRPATHIWQLALLIILALSFFQIAFGQSVFIEIFYIFPITLASWYGSRKTGIALALSSALLLTIINTFNTQPNLVKLLAYGFPCIISFSFLAILITNFRNVHRVESTAADTDSLTNINNSRGFYVELANELLRSTRYQHIFSLAYIDVDNFKNINDTLGHAEGDRVLIEIANCLKESLRITDSVARLGGDEFACLLPETEQEDAKLAFAKASALLKKRMKNRHWPISFSVGLVTFETIPSDIKEAMRISDDLMYSVKNAEKNNVSYKLWHGKA